MQNLNIYILQNHEKNIKKYNIYVKEKKKSQINLFFLILFYKINQDGYIIKNYKQIFRF